MLQILYNKYIEWKDKQKNNSGDHYSSLSIATK